MLKVIIIRMLCGTRATEKVVSWTKELLIKTTHFLNSFLNTAPVNKTSIKTREKR